MSDWWNQPMWSGNPEPNREGAGSDPGAGGVTCPWCSAVGEASANHCSNCGAVMAQRESLGGLVIPGVTDVDPAMRQPSLTGSFLGTQARMNALGAVGSSAGRSAELAAAALYLAKGSIAGMLAPETNPEQVGRPSQAALAMARRLGPSGPATDTAGDDPPAGAGLEAGDDLGADDLGAGDCTPPGATPPDQPA